MLEILALADHRIPLYKTDESIFAIYVYINGKELELKSKTLGSILLGVESSFKEEWLTYNIKCSDHSFYKTY